MKTVWKYEMEGANREFEMPVGAEIIHVSGQNRFINASESYMVPCLWAIVDTDAPRVVRSFVIVGTGIPMPDAHNYRHLGTVMDGAFVWHLFEDYGAVR